MSNIVQARNSVQVSEILIFSTATATPVSVVELPGVLTVVPEESDRLGLSPVSDVRTVSAINEDLVISVSTTYNTEYFISQTLTSVTGKLTLHLLPHRAQVVLRVQ